jgi:hypothetical protein
MEDSQRNASQTTSSLFLTKIKMLPNVIDAPVSLWSTNIGQAVDTAPATGTVSIRALMPQRGAKLEPHVKPEAIPLNGRGLLTRMHLQTINPLTASSLAVNTDTTFSEIKLKCTRL